jgi:putative tricarboxylic transport membrane protein
MVLTKNLSFIISILLVAISLFILIESLTLTYYSDYGPGPGFLPIWISGILLILSAIYMFQSFRKEKITFTDILPKGEGLRNLIVCIGSLLVFLFVLPFLGFLLSSILFLWVLFKQGYSWIASLGLSLLVTIIIFGIFSILLDVPLPKNFLGW